MILVYQVCNVFITGGQYLVRFLGSASIFISATSQYHVNLESETTLFLWRDFKMSGRSCGTPLISVLLLRSSRDVRNSSARDILSSIVGPGTAVTEVTTQLATQPSTPVMSSTTQTQSDSVVMPLPSSTSMNQGTG